ncbi:hypothetical protein QWY87_09295 [Lutimonas halocynthiae]|uniref:hypothetical protein n=1 Tax=Lutimonas halocynthiae TaxID=1446477 RepID=UPI0025B4B59C|nr:hypothetical protein [Lutimonas halocynthiae]MDN3642893.1 hypothetical protein [Lutimonas halocynthiae]
MLVASLSLLIGMLLGGGNISAFVIEDFPKEVKTNIDDKERQKEVISSFKPYEKEFKKVQKDLNKSKKKMKKLNLDRNASSKDIQEILDDANLAWKGVQTTGVQNRVKTLEMLSDEEWELIIAKSLEEFDKKEIKKQEKAYKEFEKNFAKLQSTVEKEISDADHKAKILATLDTFKSDMKNYVDANMNRTIRELEEFGEKDANEEELNEALAAIDDAREQFFDGIVKLHFDLVESTTDEEWTKIAKSVNKIF